MLEHARGVVDHRRVLVEVLTLVPEEHERRCVDASVGRPDDHLESGGRLDEEHVESMQEDRQAQQDDKEGVETAHKANDEVLLVVGVHAVVEGRREEIERQGDKEDAAVRVQPVD